MSSWQISRVGSNKAETHYPSDTWSQPDILIIPFLKNWIQFLLYRADRLRNYFLNPTKHLDIFDTHKMLSEGYIDEEFHDIMKCSFSDIKRGQRIIAGVLVNIPLTERLTWLLVNESQIIDTLSFNLIGYIDLIEKCSVFATKYDELDFSDSRKNEFIEEFGSLFEK